MKLPVFLILLVLYLMTLFLFEYMIGLGPGVAHIDEQTYLNPTYSALCGPGRGYFCVSLVMNHNLTILVVINIVLYIATSIVLYSYRHNMKSFSTYVLFILVILDPYRAHLALHVLKDTFVIFLVIAGYHYRKYFLSMILLMITFRSAGLLYIFAKQRNILKLFILSILILIIAFFYFPQYFDNIMSGGSPDMQFKEYDNIPTFNEFGFLGDVLRAIVWPILTLSGGYLFISHAPLFIPLFFAMAILTIWSLKSYKCLPFVKGSIITLVVFAFLVPGFTSYLRYVYPIIVLTPLLLIMNSTNKYTNKKRM
jgi:hypothetical protein